MAKVWWLDPVVAPVPVTGADAVPAPTYLPAVGPARTTRMVAVSAAAAPCLESISTITPAPGALSGRVLPVWNAVAATVQVPFPVETRLEQAKAEVKLGSSVRSLPNL